MTATEKRSRGDLGEELAARFLVGRGFAVLARNYLKPWGEIDIIVGDKEGNIRFVEVKTAITTPGSHETVQPEENLHPKKLERLNRAIQSYLWEKRIDDAVEWQIDAVCVRLDEAAKKAFVEHYQNI